MLVWDTNREENPQRVGPLWPNEPGRWSSARGAVRQAGRAMAIRRRAWTFMCFSRALLDRLGSADAGSRSIVKRGRGSSPYSAEGGSP